MHKSFHVIQSIKEYILSRTSPFTKLRCIFCDNEVSHRAAAILSIRWRHIFLCAHESDHWSSKCYIRRPYSYLLNCSRRETIFVWHQQVLVSFCYHLFCVWPERPSARRRQRQRLTGWIWSQLPLLGRDWPLTYTGAILPLGTGLLTEFLNREVTVLPGLTSYSLLWEIIWNWARVTTMEGWLV